MENINNDDVKRMLEMLKEQTGATSDEQKPKAKNDVPRSDDEIKEMLKKHFSAGEDEATPESAGEYAFDTIEEVAIDEEIPEEIVEETIEEEIVEETIEETIEEEIVEEIAEEVVEEEILPEAATTIFEAAPSIIEEPEEEIVEDVQEDIPKESFVEEIVDQVVQEVVEESSATCDEIVGEIQYDEALEGQQGTVLGQFVEDLAGDLDDVVFEAEITDSHAPNKQYTIFEDWEALMKNKDYDKEEGEIIPPTKEELAHSAEIAKRAKENTDYFNPIESGNDLDAVDIALMVALGGESELNQTVGFEKVRQAVNDSAINENENLGEKSIYGYCGDEYTSTAQNSSIKRKYSKNKYTLVLKSLSVGIITMLLMIYELAGWFGHEFSGILSINKHPVFHVLLGFALLVVCAILSYKNIVKTIKQTLDFFSIAYIGAILLTLVNFINDICIIAIPGVGAHATFHTLPALLMLINFIYELFALYSQSGVFDIIASKDKKLTLEPYGKLRVGEGDDAEHSEILDKDSYCIAKVPFIHRYFSRVSEGSPYSIHKMTSLVLCLSLSLCVPLVLILMGSGFETITAGFVITLSFSLICASIFESEFAFFVAYKALKKYKTGIIGKSSVAEYGKCNLIYFDDFNVFNNKSVRTKGLKLYDNNEIYRVLYHTQAVFSKIGGPLKDVFEFATTEMTHSKKVDIKEISKEGVLAIVDNRTNVLIGTGSFMKSRGIHPSYTRDDVKAEEAGEESIMFIALNGVLGAKLYVTYKFSSEFELLARKLAKYGVGIGIRSSDPNINNKWAKKYEEHKAFRISVVKPTLREFKPHEKKIDAGIVSSKNVRALAEALMMCIKLDSFEKIISRCRTAAIILTAILSLMLVILSGVHTVSMLVLSLSCAFGASIMALLTHFYIKK